MLKTMYLLILECSIALQKETRLRIPDNKHQNCCVFNKTGHVLATSGTTGNVYLWQYAHVCPTTHNNQRNFQVVRASLNLSARVAKSSIYF